MWTCPCGTSNEPHAIFCSACGKMRAGTPVPPVYEPAEPAPLPEMRAEFKGTAAGFAAAWIFATLGGGLVSWMLGFVVSLGVRYADAPGTWAFTLYRLGTGIAFGFVYGGVVGAAQAWVLARRVPRPGWRGWVVATLGGAVCVSMAANLVPIDFWANDTLLGRLAMTALVGVIGGGFLGLLQSRILSRVVSPGGWSAWWLVSAGAVAAGNVVGTVSWNLLYNPMHLGTAGVLVAGLAHTLSDGALVGLLTGPALARMVRRRCAVEA
jgi:hypothetical protein